MFVAALASHPSNLKSNGKKIYSSLNIPKQKLHSVWSHAHPSITDATYDVDTNETVLELDKPVVKNGYIIVLSKDISPFLEKNENIYNLSIHKSLKFDKIKGNLKIRVRRNGDLFRYGGMTHKVK